MLVSAEFRESHATAAAIQALAAAGFDKGAMDVFSTQPVEFAPGVLDRRSHMSLLAVAGAVANALLATAFMFWTQRDYPLVTGGMPLTSYWAVGVIIFEMTMAGAMAGTVLAFLWESGLLRRSSREPAPRAHDESIFLRLRCDDSRVPDAGETMRLAGAVDVKPLGEAR